MEHVAGRRGLLLGTLLLGALAPAAARATVVWTATMEKGDLSEWTSMTNGTKQLDGSVRTNIQASTERPYAGRYSCKVTVHPDDDFGQYHQDRADIKHDSTLTGEGKDSYLSGYYFLPEDAKTRDEIAFYETKVTSRNWMDLWIEPKTGGGGGTTVKFGIESNGANLGSVLVWTGDWKAGQWHQFAIHVHWSTDATKGIVDLWLDGQPVVTGYKHKTKFDANDMFFQTGIHRVLMQPYVETIYFDDLIEADTLAEIQIGAPTPGGGADAGGGDAATDGGAAGAGGTGGSGGAGTTGASGAPGTAGTTGAAGTSGGGTTGTAGVTGGGGATATGGATGTGGTGGGNGAGGTGGTGGTTTGTTPGGSSGGCACALANDRSGAASSIPTAALLALAWTWARRRRARAGR